MYLAVILDFHKIKNPESCQLGMRLFCDKYTQVENKSIKKVVYVSMYGYVKFIHTIDLLDFRVGMKNIHIRYLHMYPCRY